MQQREEEVKDGGLSPVGRAAVAGAVLLAIVAVALIVLVAGGDKYEVTVRFQNAGQLVRGNLVQTAGRPVGTVEEIELARDGSAEVRIVVDDEIAPLRRGTEATIRQASLSGVANRYVDLMLPTGEEREEIADGDVIDTNATTTAIDLDQVFALFDDKTRKGLRRVIRGFGETYEGRSREANAGWEYLNPSLVASQRLFEELSSDEAALEGFLVSNSRLLNDVAERSGSVEQLVDRLATTLNAIAREKGSLSSAIEALPPFLRRANTTFVNLRAALDDLDPLVAESKPVAPKLRAVLRELRPFARDAAPTFRDLSSIVRRDGADNDLIDLGRSTLPFRDVTTRSQNVNGAQREGSFPAAVKSLRSQTPQFAFQRPYVVDLTGWFDDFSHSGVYDANGSASRVALTVSAFALLNGTLQIVPEELRALVFGRVASLGQRNRCPGSTERPAGDKSNPFKPSPDYDCDETQVPPGR